MTAKRSRSCARSGQSLHFLADPDERDALAADARFFASPHHGDRGWFALRFDGTVGADEIGELLEQAYRQVALGTVNG